jgi:D-glycero-D-manno-heptose 1,7-bisphosphate phosphatase
MTLCPAVFLDRDGVLNRAIVRDGRPYAPRSLDEFEILPEAPAAVTCLKRAGYRTIVVTNQKDIGAGLTPRAVVEVMNDRLREVMPLDDIRMCTCTDECACYKPRPGLLLEAARIWNIDLSLSVMIGDRWRDIGAGQQAGCRTILIDRGYAEPMRFRPDMTASDLAEAARLLLAGSSTDAEGPLCAPH